MSIERKAIWPDTFNSYIKDFPDTYQ
jgi:hypothetical protein